MHTRGQRDVTARRGADHMTQSIPSPAHRRKGIKFGGWMVNAEVPADGLATAGIPDDARPEESIVPHEKRGKI